MLSKAKTHILNKEYEEAVEIIEGLGNYKEEFKKAFYKITDEEYSFDILGLYKYDDVLNVIKSNLYANY